MKIFNDSLYSPKRFSLPFELVVFSPIIISFSIFFISMYGINQIPLEVSPTHVLNGMIKFSPFMLLLLCLIVSICFYEKKGKELKNDKPHSNPIIEKLINSSQKYSYTELVDLWKTFKNGINNSIILDKKDIELFQKLDNELVSFINQSNNKFLNLDDFQSYRILYMKYVAKNKIQSLSEKIQHYKRMTQYVSDGNKIIFINKLNLLNDKIINKKEKIVFNEDEYFTFQTWQLNLLNNLKEWLEKLNGTFK